MKNNLLAVLLLVLLIGCSDLPKGPLVSQVEVVLQLQDSFPTSKQGFSGVYSRAEIKIFRESETLPIQTTKIEYSTFTKVYLDPNQTYRFETTLFFGDLEVAWGEVNQQITQNINLFLKYSTIVKELTLSHATFSPKENRLYVPLTVVSKTTYGTDTVPLSDFDLPTYQVEGGTIAAESKLGVEVIPETPNTLVKVNAKVSALTAPAQKTTLSLVRPFETVPATLIAGESKTINVSLKNSYFSNSTNIKLLAITNPASPIEIKNIYPYSDQLELPDGIELANRKMLVSASSIAVCNPKDFGEGLFTAAKLEWHRGNQILKTVVGKEPKPIEKATLGYIPQNDLNYSYYLLFSTLATHVVQNCFEGRTSFYIDLDLKQGWNWVRYFYDSGPGGSSSSSETLDPTQTPDTLGWYGLISDTSAAIKTNPITPVLNQPYSYIVTIAPGNLYESNVPVSVEGIVIFPSPSVQLAKTNGKQTDSTEPNSICEWSHPTGYVNAVVFKCVFGHNVPIDFEIPLTAPNQFGSLLGSVRIDKTTYVDENLQNNQAAIDFSPSQSAVQISLDTTNPAAFFNTPSSAIYSNQSTVISGPVYDDVGVEKVELYQGLSLLGIAGLKGDKGWSYKGQWSFAWVPKSDGAVILRAVAYDYVGNTSTNEYAFNVSRGP